ncbi:hypothetical protein WN944_007021 [Citrus x changshan-huyou]|uniref:MATH domain-containing protein n=1 Tax=Citrus x changshan-huyou TaxID=2935761 RepID=A0AAP0MMR1_9ROSI
MKPSAQIRGPPEKPSHGPNMSMTNHGMKSLNPKTPGVQTSRNKESDRHLFSSSKNIWPKPPFSTIAMMMRHPRPAGTTTHYRHLETNGSDLLSLNYNRNGFDGVLEHHAVVAAKVKVEAFQTPGCVLRAAKAGKARFLQIGNGCGDGDHLSLYLAFGDSTVKNVAFTLVENKDWFNTPSDNWGRPRFVSLSELDEPETGFLVNGVCVVEAEVTVLGISKPL